jgi:hypothetical protein
MSARDRSPACSGLGDLLEHSDATLTAPPVTPEQVELCARMIARHARTPDDGDLLASALGIDCAAREWALAERINRLADSIGAA